jgi:hypothetical protein
LAKRGASERKRMMQISQTDSTLKQVMSDILVLQNDELEIVAVLLWKTETEMV